MNRKKSLILLSIVLFAAAITIFAITRSGDSGPAPAAIDYNQPTEEQKQTGQQTKLDKVNSPSSATPSPAPAADTVAIASIAPDESGQNVVFMTRLENSSTWSKCTLSLSQGSTTVTKTSQTLYQQTFTSCLGFSVPKTEFPAAGTWKATLTAQSTDQQQTASKVKEFIVTK